MKTHSGSASTFPRSTTVWCSTVVFVVATLVAGAEVHAQSGAAAPLRARADSAAERSSMQLGGAAWLMGLSGTVRPSKVAQTATLDPSSNRVWESDAATAYITMLYRRRRFVLSGDLSGFHSTDAGRLASGEAAVVAQRLQVLTVTPGFAWLDGERGSLAVLGGVRVWRMSNSVSVPSLSVQDKARTSYYDVVFATRAERRFSDAITTSVYADAGGFQIASDLTWQIAGTLALRTSEQWSLIAGYRHLSVNYRGDNKRVQLRMYGPSFGAAVHF